MTKPGARIAILLAATLAVLTLPVLNVMGGFAGLGHPPLRDVAAVFFAAAILSCLAPPSRPLVRVIIASGMAFIMCGVLMSFWYSADSEAKAFMVWILGFPASLLLGALVGLTSWLETVRARHLKS